MEEYTPPEDFVERVMIEIDRFEQENRSFMYRMFSGFAGRSALCCAAILASAYHLIRLVTIFVVPAICR